MPLESFETEPWLSCENDDGVGTTGDGGSRMSAELRKIIERDGPHRKLRHEKWWSTPPKEDILKRAREDAERSIEELRPQLERLLRSRRSDG